MACSGVTFAFVRSTKIPSKRASSALSKWSTATNEPGGTFPDQAGGVRFFLAICVCGQQRRGFSPGADLLASLEA